MVIKEHIGAGLLRRGIMMKSCQSKQSSSKGILVGFVFVCIWTGILIWAASKNYYFSDILEKKVSTLIVEKGVSNTVVFDYINADNEETKFAQKMLSQTSALSYIIENMEDLPEQQGENMVKIVSYFSGNQSKEVFWSGAASNKSLETSLFQSSDEQIATFQEEEKNAKLSAEAKKQEEIKNQDSEEESNQTSDSEDVVQSITIFNNGSSDITSANKSDTSITKERDHLGNVKSDSKEKIATNLKTISRLTKTNSRSYLLKKFYITDSSTSIDNNIFQVNKLLNMDLKLNKNSKPQILILHTHGASESFIDSRKGKQEDSIIGVGTCLAQVLSEKYGYQVIHDKTEYDKINGRIDRNKAYNNAYNGLKKTLKKYPSIQVVIDLHRDGVGNSVKRTTIVDGKRTAQVMFFNGLSRNSSGDIAYLHNDNLQGNLAFSLQLKIASMKHFENFARPVYLKGYRYNMHVRQRYSLIELGNENNTVEEAKNAAAPIAMILNEVLTGK